MKYCESTTHNHPIAISYPDCLQEINELIAIEDRYGTVQFPLFVKNETVINLDAAERLDIKSGGRKQNRSMDISFGITDNETEQLVVLTELKLNIKNPGNISTKELSEKVVGSKLLMGDAQAFHTEYFIVYPKGLTEQVKNRLYRPFSKVNKQFNVVDIFELKAKFFE